MGLDLIKLVLFNEEQTLEFGTICARNLPPVKGQNILLTGDLGSGKTTFTRGLVRSLPGGNEAEISSPSFNICNLYPTEPPVAHFDLYRLENQGTDESLLEYLSDPDHLVIVEWIEHLPDTYWPDEYILLQWEFSGRGRAVTLSWRGKKAEEYVHNLQPGIRAAFTE